MGRPRFEPHRHLMRWHAAIGGAIFSWWRATPRWHDAKTWWYPLRATAQTRFNALPRHASDAPSHLAHVLRTHDSTTFFRGRREHSIARSWITPRALVPHRSVRAAIPRSLRADRLRASSPENVRHSRLVFFLIAFTARERLFEQSRIRDRPLPAFHLAHVLMRYGQLACELLDTHPERETARPDLLRRHGWTAPDSTPPRSLAVDAEPSRDALSITRVASRHHDR